MILAAGSGSRMTHPDSTVSKPMTKVLGKPLIAYAIDAMLYCEIEKIAIIYSSASEDILSLKDSYQENKFMFIKQDNVNGSLSSLFYSRNFVQCPFIMMDADIIIDGFKLKKMLYQFKYHSENMVITAVNNPSFEDKKVLLVNSNHLVGFSKKGYQKEIGTYERKQGGMVYLWFHSPFDLIEEYIRNGCNKLSVFLEKYTRQYNVGVMHIEDLWDVDSPEDVLMSENILLREYTNTEKIKAIRLIMMDLDNTILHTDKTISEYTKKIINEMEYRGIKTFITTARIFPTSKGIYEELGCTGISYSNGAEVICGKSVILQNLMSFEDVEEVLIALEIEYPHIKVSVMFDDAMYSNSEDAYTIHMDSWESLPRKDIQRILLKNVYEGDCGKLNECFGNKLYIQRLEKNNILIASKLATKENALSKITEYFGLHYENILAFGDDINDIEFMKRSGMCIAVNNAVDEVKEIADYICSSNNEDGVARWLEKNVLLYY